MLTIKEFRALLSMTGEPVNFTTTKEPVQSLSIYAIVQPVNARDEALINSYGVGSKSIQICALDIPVQPVKFDVVLCRGERLVIDTVVPQHTRSNGLLCFYLCYVKGK